MDHTDKKQMQENTAERTNKSMEDTKNQNHNSKKEGLGPNTKR